MKEMLSNDKCYAVKGASVAFASDGVLRDEIDIEEARQAFAFDIVKKPCYTEDGREIGGVMHLRRSDDDAVIPTRGLGRDFVPVQHHELFNYVIDEIMPKMPQFKLETVGTINGGGTGIMMGTFGDEFQIAGDKSPYVNRLFFFNPNGKSSVVMGFTNVRFFCQNQLLAAVASAGKNGFRVSHTKNAELVLDNAMDEIANQLQVANMIRLREERLAAVPVGDRELRLMLDKLYPLNKYEEGSRGWTRQLNLRNAVVEQFTTGKTAQEFTDHSALMLFQSITYQIHNPASIGDGTDFAHITMSNTVGNRAQKVHKIFSDVEKLVGVAA